LFQNKEKSQILTPAPDKILKKYLRSGGKLFIFKNRVTSVEILALIRVYYEKKKGN
jgi:hypothetical protein